MTLILELLNGDITFMLFIIVSYVPHSWTIYSIKGRHIWSILVSIIRTREIKIRFY